MTSRCVRRRAILGVLLVTSAAMLSLPPFAEAATTCVYDAKGKTVTVVNKTENYVAVRVTDNGSIEGFQIDCGDATVDNTDTIIVRDRSGQPITLSISSGDSAFAPGFTDEPGTSDEIEFEFDLGTYDQIQYILGADKSVRVGSGPDTLATRLNLNADESDGIDADVFVDEAVKRVYISANAGGPSRLDASGGAGTGSHFAGSTVLVGSLQSDVMIGGLRRNEMLAFDGNDELLGQDGYDKIKGNYGDDDIFGADGDDVLKGEDGEDEIHGGPGDDHLRGQKDNDTLYGEGGVDALAGGEGTDSCFGGGDGDSFSNCEN